MVLEWGMLVGRVVLEWCALDGRVLERCTLEWLEWGMLESSVLKRWIERRAMRLHVR